MRHPLHGMLAAIGATLLIVGTGVWLAGRPGPERDAAYDPTALEDYDTSTVALTRGPFCDLLDDAALEHALGGEVTQQRVWVDGDRLPQVGVVHEYGCRLHTDGPARASAWVLASPVTRDRARRLAGAATQEADCRERPDAPAYGAPSVALLCPGDRRTTASYRGLFGDAWLSCTLALPPRVPEKRLLERAGAWCVAVAEAARR